MPGLNHDAMVQVKNIQPMHWQTEQLVSVTCDLCGSADHKLVITRPDGLSVVECKHCALCFLNPRPSPPNVAKLYNADYFQHQAPGSQVGYANYLGDAARRGQRLEAQSRFATIKKHLSPKAKRCLEVGCATGEFSALLDRLGWDVTGIDISSEAIRHAKARFPEIDLKSGDIDSLGCASEFDLICAFEVIEHVLSPRRFFSEAANALKPEGVLVLTTPNYGCASRLGAPRWVGFQTSFEHLYFLSPATMRAYAALSGFDLSVWLTDKSPGLAIGENGRAEAASGITARQRIGRTKLLQPVRRFKHFIGCWRGTNYLEAGEGHNLMLIFRKTRISHATSSQSQSAAV